MSSITCTSQANLSIENHKAKTGQYWQDPEYQAIAAKRIEGETCHYCTIRPATLAHHDNANSYKSKKEYYDPKNMTPCCGTCHEQYRQGKRICPECHAHYYMPALHDKCRVCRGETTTNKYGKIVKTPKHPCGHRVARQRCQRDGRMYVCGRSSMDAAGCDHYQVRVQA